MCAHEVRNNGKQEKEPKENKNKPIGGAAQSVHRAQGIGKRGGRPRNRYLLEAHTCLRQYVGWGEGGFKLKGAGKGEREGVAGGSTKKVSWRCLN